jgi:hypothetical protein
LPSRSPASEAGSEGWWSSVVSHDGLKPTKEARGIAGVNAGLDDIFGNNGAGSDDHLVADRNREDGGIGSDTHVVAKFSLSPEFRLSRRSAGHEEIVDEHRAMRDETIIANADELADERVRLNPATLPDGSPFLNLDEWPDEGVVADFAAIEIDRLHDSDVPAEFYLDNSDRANSWKVCG